MTSEVLERFRNLDSAILLHCAAFEMSQYAPEAQRQLNIVLMERRIDESMVTKYRALRFPRENYDLDCENCGGALTVEQEELQSGRYTCPECSTSSYIPYPEIEFDERQSAYALDPNTEFPVVNDDAIGAISDELAPNPVAEVLGQSASIPRIQADDDDVPAEIKLEVEGLPETLCAKCGKILGPQDTFIEGENFYCENCRDSSPLPEENLEEEAIENEKIENEAGYPFRYLALYFGMTITVLVISLLKDGEGLNSTAVSMSLGHILAIGFLMYQLLARKRSFRLNYILYAVVVFLVLLLKVLGEAGLEGVAPTVFKPLEVLITHAISSAFWIWYIGVSERMKSIFIN